MSDLLQYLCSTVDSSNKIVLYCAYYKIIWPSFYTSYLEGDLEIPLQKLVVSAARMKSAEKALICYPVDNWNFDQM